MVIKNNYYIKQFPNLVMHQVSLEKFVNSEIKDKIRRDNNHDYGEAI